MKWIRPALAAAIIAASGIAHAHGDASPATEAGAVRKEQKAWGIEGDAAAARRTIEIPGGTGEILWRFNRAGSFPFASLVAGHYEAEMRGTVGVAPGTSHENAIVVAQADTTMTDGEVRKIDKDNRKITLRHGEIRNLDMPAMTMVYHVKDRALLERVKQGDKVRFHAEQVNGAIVITALEPVR